MLSDLIELFQDATNEASVNAKYDAAKIIKFFNRAAPLICNEIFRVSDGPNSVRWTLNIVSGQETYARPPHMGEILRMAKVDSSNRVKWTVKANSRFNPYGPGVIFDGPNIRFEPVWNRSEALQVWYIPNGQFSFVEGVFDAASTALAPVLGAVSNHTDGTALGSRDTRENAYAGYILQSTNAAGLIEHRAVDSSSFSTGSHVLNVTPAFSAAPVAADTYTMLPIFGLEALELIAVQAALDVLRFEGMQKREAGVQRMWQQHMRMLRLVHGSLDNIAGKVFTEDHQALDSSSGRFFFETLN